MKKGKYLKPALSKSAVNNNAASTDLQEEGATEVPTHHAVLFPVWFHFRFMLLI